MLGLSVQAQHSLYDRVYPAFLLLWVPSAIVISWSDRTFVVFGAIAAFLGSFLLWRVLRVWTVIDAAGWHGPKGLISRDNIKEIVLFRGEDARSDFIRTMDGQQVSLADLIPAPYTRGLTVPFEAIDLLCHLQHDLAHDLGWPPVPVRIDFGPGQPFTPFHHPCARCSAG